MNKPHRFARRRLVQRYVVVLNSASVTLPGRDVSGRPFVATYRP